MKAASFSLIADSLISWSPDLLIPVLWSPSSVLSVSVFQFFSFLSEPKTPLLLPFLHLPRCQPPLRRLT